jgi:hypothetical protein
MKHPFAVGLILATVAAVAGLVATHDWSTQHGDGGPKSMMRSGGDEPAIRSMESRLSRLEQSTRTQLPRAAAPKILPSSIDDEPRPTPEKLHERVVRGRAIRDAQFAQEYEDRAWSRAATDGLTKMLAGLAGDAGFELDEVACRTSLCRAKLRWPSYSEAMTNWQTVLAADTGMQCQNEMFVPPPPEPDAPYSALAFFDCTDERAK